MDTRVALVTGGSSGIGEQTALRLSGLEVYAVARRVDRMASLAEGHHGLRDGRHRRRVDGERDRADHRGAGPDRRTRQQRRVRLYGAVEDVPIDEARRQFEVNLFGLARLIQLVTPHMRRQAAGGSSTSPRSAR